MSLENKENIMGLKGWVCILQVCGFLGMELRRKIRSYHCIRHKAWTWIKESEQEQVGWEKVKNKALRNSPHCQSWEEKRSRGGDREGKTKEAEER